jgi:hypothetical protein
MPHSKQMRSMSVYIGHKASSTPRSRLRGRKAEAAAANVPLREMLRLFNATQSNTNATVEMVLKRSEPLLHPKPVERIKLLVHRMREDFSSNLVVDARITEVKALPARSGEAPFVVGDIVSFVLTAQGARVLAARVREDRMYDRVKLKVITRAPGDGIDEENIKVVHIPSRHASDV